MRTTGYLGAAFVLAGCLLVLASTGALDVTVAERGMAVDTAQDQNAFLGINYSTSKNDPVILDSTDCTGFIGNCYHIDVELVRFENNTDAELNISQTPTIQVSGGVGEAEFDPFGWEGVRYERGPPGIGRVVGDFRCPATGGGFLEPPDQQQSAMSTVSVDLVASGDNLTVDLTRTINVRCQDGPT